MYVIRLRVGDSERGVVIREAKGLDDAIQQAIDHLRDEENVEGVPVDSLYLQSDMTQEESFNSIWNWYDETHRED